MTRKRQRIYAIILVLTGVITATTLAMTALQDKVTFFYTPSELAQAQLPDDRAFRIGGLVKEDSVKRDGTLVHFIITDNESEIAVIYDGIPPDLFREGQGVVAQGIINKNGIFIAKILLAKHDENYMPPEIKDKIKGG